MMMDRQDKPEKIEPILVDVYSDEPEVRRMFEAFNRISAQLMATIDSAVRKRTASPKALRERHNARRHLQQAGMHAMAAIGFNRSKT